MRPSVRSTFGIRGGLAFAALAAAGGCADKVERCRPETLFIHFILVPFATADRLDVDVAVAGAGNPRHTQLTLTGAGSGGVEVEFPNGYPAGREASVTLTLFSGSTELARFGPHLLPLGARCTLLEVDFGPGDGGSTGNGGRAGGGRGGGGAGSGGGAAGTIGTGGVAGSTAGAGGTVAAAGRGGDGGAAGTVGAAGRGGTGGGAAAGIGGVAGSTARGGAGGTAVGGRGGTAGGCVATTEQCFNNLDDDCDGLVDCADPQCNPVAQCVGLDPALTRIGVLAGAGTACPPMYGSPTAVTSGLISGTCAGCSCTPGAVTCSTQLGNYANAAACSAGTAAGNVGTWRTGQQGAGSQCTMTPQWVTSGGDQVYGITTTAFAASAANCTAGGTATATAPTWMATAQFCTAQSMANGGCGMGRACVPVPQNNGSLCQMFDGNATCPAGATMSAWFTGYSGSQTCGACACGSPSGASCANVVLSFGGDYTCITDPIMSIPSGGRQCFANGLYHPGVALVGNATPASCQATAPVTNNTLAGTGHKTLCCL